jgi:hypothetical protein
VESGGESGHDLAHDLRFDRQHQHLDIAGDRAVVLRRGDPEARGELVALARVGLGDADARGINAACDQAANQAAGHVAAADEADSVGVHAWPAIRPPTRLRAMLPPPMKPIR